MIEELLPLSFKFVGFDAKNVEPEHVMDTVAKMFVGDESVKLGKLRPNQKISRIYNGWINSSGVGLVRGQCVKLNKARFLE